MRRVILVAVTVVVIPTCVPIVCLHVCDDAGALPAILLFSCELLYSYFYFISSGYTVKKNLRAVTVSTREMHSCARELHFAHEAGEDEFKHEVAL